MTWALNPRSQALQPFPCRNPSKKESEIWHKKCSVPKKCVGHKYDCRNDASGLPHVWWARPETSCGEFELFG